MLAKLIRFTVYLLSKLPLSFSRALGSAIGYLSCLSCSRGYKVTLKNLEIAYPELSEAERRKMANESVRQSAKMAAETPAVWFRNEKWRRAKTLSVSNEDLMLAARDSGKGVLILLPHFGNWEMAGIRIAQLMTSTAMYAPPKLSALEPLMKSGRYLADLVPANNKGVMKVFKALRRGEMTFLLPDQVPGREGGIFAPFFGRPVFTMTLVQRLVQKAEPVVLLAYAIRKKGGFDIGYMEPDPSIYSEDELEAVSAMNRSIEQLIEKAPTQYQWEYKRYKKQPDGTSAYKGY